MYLKGFFKECREKEVFKYISIYLVSSWLILQVLALIAEPLNFPQKSLTFLILILIIGFPFHIYYIWKFRLEKLEPPQTKSESIVFYKSPFHKMYFSALFVIIIICTISAGFIINSNLLSSFNFPEANSNDKIAVLKFEDYTGDKELEVIGDMASSWIVHGITENTVAQVISPKVVNDYTSIIKSQAGAVADVKNLIKTYFKPGKVITGGFYKENNKLLLQSSITDGLMDKTLISFETIECDSDSPLNCIEELKQKILGYLAIEEKKDNLGYLNKEDNQKEAYFEETPPKFEAYQYNLSALNHIDNDSLHLDFLNKAIKADPNYFEPKILLITYYFNISDYRTTDSLIKKIDMNSKLSSRQKNYLFEYESLIKGKYDKAYTAIKKEYKIAYLDMPTNQSTMVVALNFVNRPKDIDDIYNEIPMDGMNLDNCYNCGNRYYLKGLADIEQKKYTQVIDELLPISKIIGKAYLKKPLIMAYVRLGDSDALKEQYKLWELTNKEDLLNLYMFTGNEYLLANEKENANAFFSKVINEKNSIKKTSEVANSYYYKQDYKTAQDLLEELHNTDPSNIDVVVKLAISNYKNGNFSESNQYLKRLEALRTDYQFGTIDYAFAQYFAVLKDKENTFNYLRKAVASGRWFINTTFQNDPHFLIYRDTKEFDDILNYWNQFL